MIHFLIQTKRRHERKTEAEEEEVQDMKEVSKPMILVMREAPVMADMTKTSVPPWQATVRVTHNRVSKKRTGLMSTGWRSLCFKKELPEKLKKNAEVQNW